LDSAYEPRPPLAGDERVDACVIGGGVTGLSCARELARRGLQTVVLEAHTVGSGASGRNGGFLIAGAALFHLDACDRYGRTAARRLYARTLEVQEQVYELAAELGVADAVRRVGALRLAVSPDEADHVRRHADALRADGFPAEIVERAELPELVRPIGQLGCLTRHDGALQPARWIRALAGDAEALGARIYEHTPVRAPVPAPDDGPLLTPLGRVRARHVIVAADGPLPELVPEMAASVRPRRLHMIATAPLADLALTSLVYSRWGLEYMQQLPDGRLALGGFGDLDGERSYTECHEGSGAIWERLERHLRDTLALDLDVTHRWIGLVGYTADHRPRVGAVPGRDRLYMSGGYSGTGNLIGFMSGVAVAELVAVGRSEDLAVIAPPL
jgi:glycine/D-amino acid oxidase-like deaminating enzyme